MVGIVEPERRTKEVIPEGLVGRNMTYQFLREAVDRNHPTASEERYSDDYLKRLNEAHPFADIFRGRERQTGDEPKELRQFVANRLGSFDGESVLESVLMRSFEANSWQPYIFGLSKVEGLKIEEAQAKLISPSGPDYFINTSMFKQRDLFGIALAKKYKFVFVSAYKDKIIVIPSQMFVECLSDY